jgi:putative RNA 2'-phosphotransferase
LRHNPKKFGLEIDKEGFVDLNELAETIKVKFSYVNVEFIKNLINTSLKRRFQIKDNRIRALYGHSIVVDILYPQIVPPDKLYHGTTKKAGELILKEGLKPMRRKKVHLSRTPQEAYLIGRRRTKLPVILEIDSIKAYQAGAKFYDAEEVILCNFIPLEFIVIYKYKL